jgi:hypothetical protein
VAMCENGETPGRGRSFEGQGAAKIDKTWSGSSPGETVSA